MRAAAHLRVVRDGEAAPGAEAPAPPRHVPTGDAGDLALVAVLFLLNLLPVAGELSGIGRWSPGIVGLATGALLLTGRELWSQLRGRARAREPRPP